MPVATTNPYLVYGSYAFTVLVVAGLGFTGTFDHATTAELIFGLVGTLLGIHVPTPGKEAVVSTSGNQLPT